MKSVYIARDNANVPDDMVHFVERHPEKKIEFAKLHIFYDTPEWDSGIWSSEGHWKNAREMCEIPNYMFPEIKMGECLEFLPISQKELGQVKQILNIIRK